jgi:hypothetical protein
VNPRAIPFLLQVQSAPEHALSFWYLLGFRNTHYLLKVSAHSLLLMSQYITCLEPPYEVFVTRVAGGTSHNDFMGDSGTSGRTLSFQTSLRFSTRRPVLATSPGSTWRATYHEPFDTSSSLKLHLATHYTNQTMPTKPPSSTAYYWYLIQCFIYALNTLPSDFYKSCVPHPLHIWVTAIF